MSNKPNTEGSWMGRSIFLNILLIIIVAALGIWIAYISIALFTKHGQRDIVPNVENMSYTEAIKKLNAAGFKVDIRDSLYRDDIKPGYVIEQFPKWKSEVKPGRKIFLYLNAVHPKQVLIDDGKNHAEAALKGLTERQAISRLEELGFKPEQIKLVKVLGENDRVVKILANGRTVRKGEKISVKAKIILEVYDGRLTLLRDSLQNMELSRAGRTYYYSTEKGHEGTSTPTPALIHRKAITEAHTPPKAHTPPEARTPALIPARTIPRRAARERKPNLPKRKNTSSSNNV